MKIELTYLQMVLIGMGVGFILGLIPLVLGIIKGKKKIALWGFVASIAVGAAWSLFSLVAVIVAVWLILRKPAETKPAESEVVNEKPTDVAVKDSEDSEDS
jgi:hypothetical protein